MTMTLPNFLTLIRIVLIPFLILVFYLPVPWSGPLAAYLFLACSLTDWLDGYLARRLNQTSNFGRFLDPVADKLLVTVTLILLVDRHPSLVIPAIIIVGREIIVSALREWMASAGESTRVAVSTIGKMKTGIQMAALVMLLYGSEIYGIPMFVLGVAFLYLAVGLTLWSLLVYLRAAWPTLSAESR